jgi:murein L,D-transpeptidase YafK
MSHRALLIFSFFLLFPIVLPLQVHGAQGAENEYEHKMLRALNNIQNLNNDQALKQTREIIQNYPTSKLAQLLYADLLMAKTSMLSSIGAGIADRAEQQPKLKDLTFEIKQRLSHIKSPAAQGLLPDNLIRLAENQRYFIVIDQSQSRLYVYRNEQGTPVYETDFFISIGLKGAGKQIRGDQKTPIGVYHVTRYIDDSELPDLYGRGAFPLNYPNIWDIRKQRTGGGIWIHGTPSYTYNRPPWSSNGCVVLSNADFMKINDYIQPNQHTPVIIAKTVQWINLEQWQQQQQSMLKELTQWIADWESNNHDRYTSHYSKTDFEAYGRDYKTWEGHKRWVNRNKKGVSVEYNNLNIFRYPGENDLVTMQYDQSYHSNNLNLATPKELFWKQQKNQWSIVYEGVREYQKDEDRLVEN